MFHQQPLAAHRIEALQRQSAQQLLGSNREPTAVGVHGLEARRQSLQHRVHHLTNRPQGVVGRNSLLGREITELPTLLNIVSHACEVSSFGLTEMDYTSSRISNKEISKYSSS